MSVLRKARFIDDDNDDDSQMLTNKYVFHVIGFAMHPAFSFKCFYLLHFISYINEYCIG